MHGGGQGYADVDGTTDLGSGTNYKKKGLQKLPGAILRGEVRPIVWVTKDRLLRFGSELLFSICRFFRAKVEVLDADASCLREQRLTEVLAEIPTVFSPRLYDSRSRKKLCAVAAQAS